jgi:cytochrome c peroxidase
VAAELLRGHALFRGKAGCAGCHPATGTFSDGRFYNIGTSLLDPEKPGQPGKLGRFAVAPLGERNRYQKGAFKTPTLRSLWRTGPYFHDGQAADVTAAVRLHIVPPKKDAAINRYLDPRLATDAGSRRDFGLSEEEIRALVLFLRALDGNEVDSFVRTNPG